MQVASDYGLTITKKGNRYFILCQWHDEKTPSAELYPPENKGYCHGCKKPFDSIDLWRHLNNCTNAEAIKRLTEQFKINQQEKKRIAATYDYVDAAGNLLFQSVRMQPKGFFQRRPDGRGGWINTIKGVDPVPYRLPELMKAIQQDETIFIVEGEKDVEGITSFGLTATCNSGGSCKWTSKHSRFFNVGTNVVILPDNDEPGQKHGQLVAQQLQNRGCMIKIVELPELPPKGDVSDWIKAGHTKDELLQLVESSPYWEPTDETPISPEAKDEWTYKLDLTDDGKVKSNANNYILILENDETFQNMRFNTMTGAIEGGKFINSGGMIDDNAEAQIRIYIEQRHGIRNVSLCRDALVWVSQKNQFHPIRNYFKKLSKWDGVKRAETIFIDTLGAADNEYIRTVTRIFLAASYQRIFNPGVKFDLIMVLRGAQGIGKSFLINRLGVNWTHSSLKLTDMRDAKVAGEKIQGYWIIEIPELAGMSNADIESVKAFITSTDDVFRAAYARKAAANKRQSVMIASTNAQHGYLRDETGGRRFIDIHCTGNTKLSPLNLTREYIDQLWSEVQETLSEHSLYLSGDFLKQAEADQQEQIEQDPREDIVAEYLDKPIPGSWYKMPLYDRQAFLDNRQAFMTIQDTDLKPRQCACIAEIYEECFKLNKGQIQPKDRAAIHRILMRLGWKPYEGKKRCGAYGGMYGFERPQSQCQHVNIEVNTKNH